ncbi:hypothetical protein U0070_004477 [Myodes glareolus]|uniref:Uncharacterized protein n=1 Tax=Myodes glareolus TaxID=447135 RepID=A0AAW0H4W2_MYOGA
MENLSSFPLLPHPSPNATLLHYSERKLAEQLKAQLKEANKFKETIAQISTQRSRIKHEDEEVILTRRDESGRVWPVNTPGGTLDMKAKRRKRQGVSTHEDKERIRYFPDDHHLSLKDLVKNEKMGRDIDQNRLFMRMASKRATLPMWPPGPKSPPSPHFTHRLREGRARTRAATSLGVRLLAAFSDWLSLSVT